MQTDAYAEARTKISEWEKKLAEGWIPVASGVLPPTVGVVQVLDLDLAPEGGISRRYWNGYTWMWGGEESKVPDYWRPIPPAPEPADEGMTEERLAVLERTDTNWAEGKELGREVRRSWEHIAACREECDELKAAVRRLQSEKDCWQAACSRGDLDIAELEKNVVMARNHVVSQAGELADRDARIAELEKQLASMTALCGDREQAMFSYRNKLELSERKVAHLEAEVAVLLQAEPPAAEPHQQPCPECGGTGVVDDGNIPCGACGGSGADTPVAEPHVSDEELARWEFQLVNYVPEGEWIPFDSYRMCQELRRLQSLVRPVAVDTGEHDA